MSDRSPKVHKDNEKRCRYHVCMCVCGVFEVYVCMLRGVPTEGRKPCDDRY